MNAEEQTDDTRRPLTPAEAATLADTDDETIRRWIKVGVRIHGRLIRLTASRSIGCRFRTTVGELRAFQAACQRARGLADVAESPTPAARRRAGQAAKDAAAKLLG